jgi:hypothetical protein
MWRGAQSLSLNIQMGIIYIVFVSFVSLDEQKLLEYTGVKTEH